MSSGKLVGLVLLVAGMVVGVIAALFLLSGLQSGNLTSSGALLGLGIVFVVLIAPLEAFGIILFVQGRKDEHRAKRAARQRQLLDIVQSRGQVNANDLALEMQISVDDLKTLIHELVGLQVFSGYINWEKGELYSDDARHLRELQQCRNCGGEIQLSGKGVLSCRFCGTEYYLS